LIKIPVFDHIGGLKWSKMIFLNIFDIFEHENSGKKASNNLGQLFSKNSHSGCCDGLHSKNV